MYDAAPDSIFTVLFEKGDIFYSRRVGSRPDGYYSVEDSLNEGKYNKDNPAKIKP